MERRRGYLTLEQLRPCTERKALPIRGIGAIEEPGARLPTGADRFAAQRFLDALAGRIEEAHPDLPFRRLPAIRTGCSATGVQRRPGAIQTRAHRHGHDARDHGLPQLGAPENNAARRGAAGGSIRGGEDVTSVMLRPCHRVDTQRSAAFDDVSYPSDFIAGDSVLGATRVSWSAWYVHRSRTGLPGEATPSTAETGRVPVEAWVRCAANSAAEYRAFRSERPETAAP